MSKTVILPCSCKHEDQDVLYGKNQRLHNISGTDESKAYCTVCCIQIDPKTGKPAVNNLGKYIKNGKTFKGGKK